eukprot:604891-Rhodomonas_salina.1
MILRGHATSHAGSEIWASSAAAMADLTWGQCAGDRGQLGKVAEEERTATECGPAWQLRCALGNAVWDQGEGTLKLT